MLSTIAYPARLEEARQRAQVSRLNLAGLKVTHNLCGRELSLLLQLPGPFEHGINAHQADLHEVARLIALSYGAETWANLPTERIAHYLTPAYELVMDSPMPRVLQSSVCPPE